jgi:uncharacterized phage protein gp47/JayE
MARNNFQPVFEETETAIRDRMIADVEAAGWRAEQGDFMYDAIAPSAAEIKQLQINQDRILASRFAKYAEGPDLDDCLYDIGLERLPATPNKRALLITADAGVVINAGQVLYSVVLDNQGQPLQYTVDSTVSWATSGAQTVNITCMTPGTIGNLATGSQFILLPPVPGVRTIVDQGTTVVARDVETDEEAWQRYDFKVTHPDTGGNKNDLVRWAQEVEGVGKAKCIPRWNGVNTSKILLVGNDYAPASPTVVADTQAYMDPGAAGLGEGKVPMGNACTVAAAEALEIDIEVTGVQYTTGADPSAVKTEFESAVRDYMKSLVFVLDETTKDPLPVVYNRILALLTFTPGVSSFTNITVNGGTSDIPVGDEEVAVLGTVTM